MNKYKWKILLSTSKFVECEKVYDSPTEACMDLTEKLSEFEGYLPDHKGPTVLSADISIIQ